MAKGNEGAEPFICRPFNNSINTHHTIRDRGNRLILGVKDDVRITADHLPSPTPHISDGGLPPMTLEEWKPDGDRPRETIEKRCFACSKAPQSAL